MALPDLTTTMAAICSINTENHLEIRLCHLPKLKHPDEIAFCKNYLLCQINELLMVVEKIDIDLYVTDDIQMDIFPTIKMFFNLFKRELPNKLNKCRLYTKAKYKGFAHLFLTFADRETKARMEIVGI